MIRVPLAFSQLLYGFHSRYRHFAVHVSNHHHIRALIISIYFIQDSKTANGSDSDEISPRQRDDM